MSFIIVNSGNKSVTTSGQPVTLTPASVPANRVDIQAKFANTGIIYIGGPAISAAAPNGIGLQAGDVYSIEKMTDLLNIWLDSTVSGEGVTYSWWVGEIN